MNAGCAGPRLAARATRTALVLLALLCAIVAAFALTLPALTGRVVDRANIIPAETRITLERKLAELESNSGIQLVVTTVSSLEGQEIEPYANQLFRAWKLGEKAKNNGVLLLVAPNERRVRIEVGYGLEGTLTDALAKVIITNAITPRFKSGDFAGGITRGVEDIITVLTTDASEWQKRPSLRLDNPSAPDSAAWIIIILVIIFIALNIVSPGLRRFSRAMLDVLAQQRRRQVFGDGEPRGVDGLFQIKRVFAGHALAPGCEAFAVQCDQDDAASGGASEAGLKKLDQRHIDFAQSNGFNFHDE